MSEKSNCSSHHEETLPELIYDWARVSFLRTLPFVQCLREKGSSGSGLRNVVSKIVDNLSALTSFISPPPQIRPYLPPFDDEGSRSRIVG